MPNMELIQSIHSTWLDLIETKRKVKSTKANLKGIAEQNEEYRELEKEIKVLTDKRKEAKKILEADKDYQTVNSELEELKFRQKDLKEILSHHLVKYYGAEHTSEIEDPEGEVREIILSAKMGAVERESYDQASFEDYLET